MLTQFYRVTRAKAVSSQCLTDVKYTNIPPHPMATLACSTPYSAPHRSRAYPLPIAGPVYHHLYIAMHPILLIASHEAGRWKDRVMI